MNANRPDTLSLRSPAMRHAFAAAEDVAPTQTTVLLMGESGTGKEVLARHIHDTSRRASRPWVAVNCAALPADLLESELFGHERGAFTGAHERRLGKIELADGGTLLLDEISELPLPLQAKLLRVLQEREVDRVGGSKPVRVDVRVISTSNRDLAEMVRAGTFRTDLYYRLNVYPISLPPLRARLEDLEGLCEILLARAGEKLGRSPCALADASLARLRGHRFPGNVRELENLLERASIRARSGDVILPEHLDLGPCAEGNGDWPEQMPLDLTQLEQCAIQEALRRAGGNRTHAARMLGLSLRTLRAKLNGSQEPSVTAAAATHRPTASSTSASSILMSVA